MVGTGRHGAVGKREHRGNHLNGWWPGDVSPWWMLGAIAVLAACTMLLVSGLTGNDQVASRTQVSASGPNDPVVLTGQQGFQPLYHHWSVWVDPSATATIADVSTPQGVSRFKLHQGPVSLGYGRSRVWLHMRVRLSPQAIMARTDDRSAWVMQVGVPFLGEVDLYQSDGQGGFIHSRQGQQVLPMQRAMQGGSTGFRVSFDSSRDADLFLSVRSQGSLSIWASMASMSQFRQYDVRHTLIAAGSVGIGLAIIVYGLVLYWFGRARLYLVFSMFVGLTILVQGYCEGVVSYVVGPWMDQFIRSVPLLIGGSFACAFVFASQLMRLSLHIPWAHRVSLWMAAAYVACGTVGCFVGNWVVSPIMNTVGFFALTALLLVALLLVLRRESGAVIFLLSSLPLLMVNVLWDAQLNGMVAFSEHLGLAMEGSEIWRLSVLVLGMSIQSLASEQERRQVQRGVLQSSIQTERQLEKRVAQRTQALLLSNQALADEANERRAVLRQLRDSETLVRSVLDASPFPVLVAGKPDAGNRGDEAGSEGVIIPILFMNKQAARFLGQAEDGMIGWHLLSLLRDREDRLAVIQAVSGQKSLSGREVVVRRVDGQERWGLLTSVPFRRTDQDATLLTFSDITAQKVLQQTIERAHQQTEDALKRERRARAEQRNFLALVSHEVRVPLAIVETSSQLLALMIGDGKSEAHGEVDKIHRAVARMSGLLETCLSDDWLDSTTMQLRLEDIDLVWLLQDVQEEFAVLVPEHRLSLHLPEAAPIRGDATLLRVVISNLMDNALKYSPETAPVEISLYQRGDMVHITPDPDQGSREGPDGGSNWVLEVRDYGAGVRDEEKEQIFDKFYRSPNVGRVNGAGLGLYVVGRIVDLHGGSILCVTPDQGKGVLFRVVLPPCPPASAQESLLRDAEYGKPA